MSAKRAPPARHAEWAARLLRAWRAGLPRQEWRALGLRELRAAAATHLAFGTRRRTGQTLLRVHSSPLTAAPGSNHSIVELITDDMPFLVSTLTMTLAETGHAVQLIAHPILTVVRGADGRLLALGARATQRAPQRESWQYLHIDRVAGEQECAALQARLLAALADVRRACEDWQAMREVTDELRAQLATPSPGQGAAALAETRALLEYMADDHFTFLGYSNHTRRGTRLLPERRGALGILRGTAADDATGERLAAGGRAPAALIVTKANRRSTVHRPGYLDYVGIRRCDRRGRLVGEAGFVGLWTASAYHANPASVPLLRQKVQRVTASFPFHPASHDAKRLASVLANLPRDELFQASLAELRQCARAVLELQEHARGVCLVMRRDELRRFWSCLVYLGRERLDNDSFRRISTVLHEALGGGQLDSSVAVSDSPLAQLHITVRTGPDAPQQVNRRRLERALNAALVTWRDRLRAALLARHDEVSAVALERRFATAFPPAYQQDVTAELAVQDIDDLEAAAAAGTGRLRLHAGGRSARGRLHLRLLRHGEPLSISAVLPVLENFGLQVISERPYELHLDGQRTAWIQDFELTHAAATAPDIVALEAQLGIALPAILAGELDNDGLHRLITSAGLTVAQVRVLRTCCRYLLQTGIPFSLAYLGRALDAHPQVTRELWRLFDRRLNPAATDRRAQREAVAIERRLRLAIGAVRNPDEDRILRALLALILAITRTNYYRDGSAARPLALKLDPLAIPGLPEPRPAFEIFVHGTSVEGVHMRRGPIARGGIRWSERPEDFRTEILGLMKAQHVKNTLIVPVGAKGGFVARRLRRDAGIDGRAREVLACYRAFISCLLEITDNVVGGEVVPPAQVRRRDGDDPYLVVAADKGTASYSDVANAIAAEYGFWLGDAFASGGSAGYDHKKMGITARGGWECVKRHFRELGRDIQREPFTVAGIGDMSGDVFGNGLLLAPQIRLLAAFDHRHVFIDPDPDARRALRERRRLFALPRSSWDDYDRKALSPGGVILARDQKTLQLTPQAQQLLGLEQARVTPVEVVRAILQLPVDLLWNGGIGTYVKAASERHGEIGDRANDAVRVDGRELRARVVGEGGNLGFSQRGRIEYAQAGGRINTDFVDNSAGVNTSDIEVNLKIMLAGSVGGAVPTGARRRELLASVTGEVATAVLHNNYWQSQALSMLERRSVASLADHQQLLRALERSGELDRALEFLPSDSEIEDRLARGQGLTRPELAVLLAYAKLTLNNALTAADIASDHYLARELERYFPARWRQRFARRIAQHPLRGRLIATATTNSILNRADPGFVMRMAAQTGADTGTIARAYTIARDSANLRALWTAIEALDNRVSAAAQYEALLAAGDYVEQLTRRLLLARGGHALTDIGGAVARLTPAFAQLRAALPGALPGIARDYYQSIDAQYLAAGFPAPLATWLAALPALRATPDLVNVAQAARRPLPVTALQYFRTAEVLGIDWLAEAIRALKTSGAWQAVARERLYTACLDGQRALCARALRERAGDGAALVRWRDALGAPGLQWQLTLRELRASAAPDLAALMAGAEALRNLAQG